MAETQKGGIAFVNGEYVDANGNKVKKQAAATTDVSAAEVQANEQQKVVHVEGISFGSDAAGEAAKTAGLVAADFEGYTPSGQEGFTKPDVMKVIASRDAARAAG